MSNDDLDASRELELLHEQLEAARNRSCACCGWALDTDPPSGHEPPIVKGALDAQAEAEQKAGRALSLLRECIDQGVFHDAACWCDEHADYDDGRAAKELGKRIRAFLGHKTAAE